MVNCPSCFEPVPIPFACSLCKKKYCTHHRMPEKHNCPFIKAYRTDTYRKIKSDKNDNTWRNQGQSVSFMEDINRKIRREEMGPQQYDRYYGNPKSQPIRQNTNQQSSSDFNGFMILIVVFLVMALIL